MVVAIRAGPTVARKAPVAVLTTLMTAGATPLRMMDNLLKARMADSSVESEAVSASNYRSSSTPDALNSAAHLAADLAADSKLAEEMTAFYRLQRLYTDHLERAWRIGYNEARQEILTSKPWAKRFVSGVFSFIYTIASSVMTIAVLALSYRMVCFLFSWIRVFVTMRARRSEANQP